MLELSDGYIGHYYSFLHAVVHVWNFPYKKTPKNKVTKKEKRERKQWPREMIMALVLDCCQLARVFKGTLTEARIPFSSNSSFKETLKRMFSWNFKSTLKNYFNTIQPGRGQRWQEYKMVEKVYDISLAAG